MAVDLPLNLPLNETLLPHDESAEDALERAIATWRAARTRLETVDFTGLSPAGRESYYRLLTRIGLWSDARMRHAASQEPEQPEATEKPLVP